jgi:hypothetical protein
MIGGYNRFQYGGYWFGFNEGWPSGWDYNDDFYVEYIDGVYYMFNLRHPGFRLTLNIFWSGCNPHGSRRAEGGVKGG